MNYQEPQHFGQACTEFDITLPTILGGPSRPFPKELASSAASADIGKWIRHTFGAAPDRSALRRFLAGEFTGGTPPYHIPDLHRIHVEKILRTLDTIEAMARAANARQAADTLAAPSGAHVDSPRKPPTEGPEQRQTKPKCTVPGCGLAHCAKGLCRPHYQQDRLRKKVEAPILVGDEQGVA